MNKQIEQIIRRYLPEVNQISLATSFENKPWVCEIFFGCDEELHLYFISRPNRRHSLEITKNKHVAGNIVKQYDPSDQKQGVYFEGTCELLENVTQTDPAFVSFCDKFGTDPVLLQEQKQENGHRWYKITVNKFYLFDELEMEKYGKYELNWN